MSDPTEIIEGEGYADLWGWFGLSRAGFLALPRVLMHEMPDEWQRQMAALLEQYDDTFPNQPDMRTRVHATTMDGKLTKFPDFLLNYRHPDKAAIEGMKRHD